LRLSFLLSDGSYPLSLLHLLILLSHMPEQEHVLIEGAEHMPEGALGSVGQGGDKALGRKGMPCMTPKPPQLAILNVEQRAVTVRTRKNGGRPVLQHPGFEPFLL